MKDKKTRIILLIITLFIVFFFCYKGYKLNYYSLSDDTIDLNINKTLKVNKYTDYSGKLKYDNIFVKNIFKDFKLSKDKYFDKYVLYDSNNKIKASFWIGLDKTFVDLLKDDSIFYGSLEKIDSGYFNKVLKKRNILNDLDLFKYLKVKSREKTNIFTSVSDMKEIYASKYLISILLPESDGITLIDGDYKGYIFNSKILKEVSILYKDKRYILTFFGLDYFTDDVIKDELNSIIIN